MIRAYSYSEAGGHEENEDAFAVRPHPEDPACYLCAVADGQGGRAGGAEAARVACRACMEAASACSPAELARPETWRRILGAADEAVAADPDAGFTTVVAICVTEARVCGASNGDSAAVLLGAGETGRVLTERQYKNPPVGSGAAAFVSFSAEPSGPWTVLAMSDGVWKYVGWDGIMEAASGESGDGIIKALRKRAALPGSGRFQDDFTLVVLRGDAT